MTTSIIRSNISKQLKIDYLGSTVSIRNHQIMINIEKYKIYLLMEPEELEKSYKKTDRVVEF